MTFKAIARTDQSLPFGITLANGASQENPPFAIAAFRVGA
jgi:hypothetical protein